MVADVNVLGARLRYRVGCHEYGPLIITANWDSFQLIAELTEQTLNPGNLVSAITQSHVFSLSGQVCYSLLRMRSPADQAICKLQVETCLREVRGRV